MLARLTKSASGKNAAASYLAFGSTAIWGLVSIPVAVSYLSKEEIGLWAVVNAILSYINYADLGIGPATGRLLADSVAKEDQTEINRWWTATRFVLWVQGAAVLAASLLLPRVLGMFQIPQALSNDATLLLVGGGMVCAISMPLRGAAGMFTAQNRYHWVPLVQATAPWFNFITFYCFLAAGFGLKAYLFGLIAGQCFIWISYTAVLRASHQRPRMDWGALEGWRFRKMFKLSGNLAFVGILQALQQTLPNILIARLGTLSVVPIYHISSRCGFLGGQLVNRSYQAFYPNLQRIHVTGNRELFIARHHMVGLLVITISTLGAAALIALNSSAVQLLADREFYAGNITTMWFGLAILTVPLSLYFHNLLTISGDMGKSALVALCKLGAMLAGSILVWPTYGITGIAAIFALAPLIDASYGYYRGARNCGHSPFSLSAKVTAWAGAAMAAIVACGSLQQAVHDPGMEISIRSHTVTLPGPMEWIYPSLLCLLPVIMLWSNRSLIISGIRAPRATPASATP